MERKTLFDAVRMVEPALAKNDYIPALRFIWFTGEAVMAYNDAIAISVPLQTEFIGAVPGELLIELLKNTNAELVELKPGGGNAVLKAGRSTVKLPMLGDEAFLFQIPDWYDPDDLWSPQFDHFLPAVENCLRSVSEYSLQSDQLGVTLTGADGILELYGTDRATLSYSWNSGTPPGRDPVILPSKFCQQMLRLSKDASDLALAVKPDYAVFSADGVVLFSRVLAPTGQIDFRSIIDFHLPQDMQTIDLPPEFASIVKRAELFASVVGHDVPMSVSCNRGRMRFETRSERGEVIDLLPMQGHPDVEINLLPRLLQRGLDSFTQILVTAECAILRKDENIYMVAKTEA